MRMRVVGDWLSEGEERECQSIVIVLEGQQMLKVVLVLKEIGLRLRDSEVFVAIRKNKEALLLASQCKVVKGLCTPNSTSQFYLSPKDPALNIEVIFWEGKRRKLGGSTVLNITEWQPNVLHQTISALKNSPDKKARLSFNFYYFMDNSINDNRSIFLSCNRFQDECQTLQQKNHQLISQNTQLKKELRQEESRNTLLLKSRAKRQLDMHQTEQALRGQVQISEKSMDRSRQSCEYSKALRKELFELAKERGLAGREDQ